MLTHMKFENRPVHLFNISGRKYPQLCPSDRSGCAYVYQWSRRRACPGKHELPAGSYESCTDLLDPLNTRKTEFPEFSEALKKDSDFSSKYVGGGRGIPNHAQNKE